MLNLDTTPTAGETYPTLSEAKALALKAMAADPAIVEIEYTVALGVDHFCNIWVGRDGDAFLYPRVAS